MKIENMKVEIDAKSGFCFGVVNAIKKAEEELSKGGVLYCLGDIVHNNLEVDRLEKLGMITINHDEFRELKNARVLLRAHGEPPSTYEIAKENNIEIIDASCPVVLRLQKRIHDKYEQEKNDDTQIVIYGKKGHAEVKGLLGQTDSNAIVIEGEADFDLLDFSKNICLFSQTTKPLDGFGHIIEQIKKKMEGDAQFEYFDTICRQVSNRIPNIKEFVLKHDIIFFVAGEKSSNGQVLYQECKKYNPKSYFISSVSELDLSLIDKDSSIGVCGATSTPKWQMEQVEAKINEIRGSDNFSK